MDNLNKSVGKVSVPSKPSIFTFVPVVGKLPVESIITEEQTSGAETGKANKIFAVSHEEMIEETMSDEEIFKAEFVFIKDSVEARDTVQPGTKLQFHTNLPHTSSDSVCAQSENMANHADASTVSMETAVRKQGGISQRQCYDTSGPAEVSSGFFANRAFVSEDRTSPTNTADLFPTPASSRESIVSEGSDREKSWLAVQRSSVTSPVSFSRTISPCSSVLSGIFSPAVVQIKRHFLAPGSSLIHTPQTCFSSCDSLSSSVCPQSPPPRHRPPLTRLSLLTAILRKGRLPVLSPALQRPYTPCWPVNPVTLSFCNACSAASSVASIPLEFASRFSSCASIDSHVHKEPDRCITAPPPVQSNEPNTVCFQTQGTSCSDKTGPSSMSRWERVVSPLAVMSSPPPQAPLPLFCPNLKSASPPKQEDRATSTKLQHTHLHRSISKSPELKLSDNNHMHLKDYDKNLKKLISTPSKAINEQGTSAPQKWNHLPNSSLSRLHLLSQKLRSAPVCPPQLQPSESRSPAVTRSASPFSNSPNTTAKCESGRSRHDSKSAHRAQCPSPSRCTPTVFPGWLTPTSSITPTPSPAPPVRDLTPSPSLSLSSTPSPRPGSGISDCGDREGKKRKTHKIKLSYKSLAAIPTNTLLLDQQAIDEQVERGESSCDTSDGVDTHAEVRSPSELRQRSEELYAVIDEILADSIPACHTSRSLQSSRSSTPCAGLQQNISSFPKSLGRETKYASLCSLYPSAVDTNKTKPGVIRPMTAIPRLTVEDEELHPNPFRLFSTKRVTDTKVRNTSVEELTEKMPERRALLSACDLQITEPEDQISPPVKAPASFSPAEGRMEAFETHI